MKAQPEITIQFSGYPLSIVETKQESKRAELKVIKPLRSEMPIEKNSITNDPKNWDVDWFNSYE